MITTKRGFEMSFSAYSEYYDALYSEKEYNQETQSLINFVNEINGSVPTSLLEYGSGTGGHALILAEAGHEILGIELSEDMLARAVRHENISYLQGDIRTVQIKQTFEVSFSLFHVVSYLSQNSDFEAFLNNANKHLCLGGYLFFDCWYGPAVINIGPSERSKFFHFGQKTFKRNAKPVVLYDKNIVEVHYEISDTQNLDTTIIKEKHVMRYFFEPEIQYFAKNNGFKLVKSKHLSTGKQPGIESWDATFCLKKIKDL